MITNLASGRAITPEEEHQVWIQRQINRAVSQITGLRYHDPLEPDPPCVIVREPGKPSTVIEIKL